MRPSTRNVLIGAALAAVAGNLVLLLGACTEASGSPAEDSSAGDRVARGRYLVTTIGCNDCHTPFTMTEKGLAPDMTRMLSGHPESVTITQAPKLDATWAWAGTAANTAFAGPWGISYASNLTPDQNTGLGIWTQEMFMRALREGKHMGTGRAILPPMPWTAYGQMNDADLKAIYAYLRSLAPIENHVPK